MCGLQCAWPVRAEEAATVAASPTQESLQLTVREGPGANCVTAAPLATTVAQLLGWPGVVLEHAAGRVEVQVERDAGARLVATVRWLDPNGEELGRREMSVGAEECERLRAGLMFSLAVERGFDPSRQKTLEVASKPQAKPPVAVRPPNHRAVAARPRSAPARPRRLSISAGVIAEGGVVPELTVGPQVALRWHSSWYGLELRSSVLAPRDHVVESDRGFQYWEVASALMACAGHQYLRVCPALQLFYAQVQGFGGALISTRDAGVGLRAGGVAVGALPLSQRFAVGVQAGLWVPAGHHDVAVGGAAAWSAGLGYSLGIELSHDFL